MGSAGERIDEVPVVGFFVTRFGTARATIAGRFESWICAACGYTELYAEDLGDVDRRAEEHPGVRIVDGTVLRTGAFR